MKRNQSNRSRTTPKEEPSMASLFSHLTVSLPATIGIFLALNLVFSLILYFLKDPAPFITPLAFLSSAASAFCGGWILCRRQRNSALLCGLINGCFFLCILLLVSLFFRASSSGYSPLVSAALHLCSLLFSILGGFAGLPRPHPHRKKR